MQKHLIVSTLQCWLALNEQVQWKWERKGVVFDDSSPNSTYLSLSCFPRITNRVLHFHCHKVLAFRFNVFVKIYKWIIDCEDAEESCVEECTAVAGNSHQEYGDEVSIAMVQDSLAKIVSEENVEEVNAQIEHISHGNTNMANVLNLTLHFVE